MRIKGINQSKRDNILLVANYDSDVGYAWQFIEDLWIEISQTFDEKGRKCILIYPAIKNISDKIAVSSIEVKQYDFSNKFYAGQVELRELIRGNDIRSIYLTDRALVDLRYLQLRLLGVRNIVLHDHTPGERSESSLIKRILKKTIHKAGIFSCTHYVGVSEFVYNRFIKSGCVPAIKCSYVYNGIRPIVFEKQYENYVREVFDIQGNEIVVITTGRATYYKGIDFIIRCAAKIIHENKCKDIKFIHCGDGPDLDEFKAMAKDLHVGDHVIFAGRRNDVERLLQSSDIAVQASKGEAFSLSILEYMSAGLATVVPNNCANGEVIRDGYNGILYEPGDREGFINAIIDLANDQSMKKYLGENASKTILEKFNQEIMKKEFRNLIEKIL
jgi:glycosyltransferase involved in cell wall biosynthesis